MKTLIIIALATFSLQSFTANWNTSKSQRYRKIMGECALKFPNDEEAILKCANEVSRAAIREAEMKKQNLPR